MDPFWDCHVYWHSASNALDWLVDYGNALLLLGYGHGWVDITNIGFRVVSKIGEKSQ